jgi:tungstate transport system permease protein
MDSDALLNILLVTLRVSGIALLISVIIGIPFGTWIGLRQFAGKNWIKALIYTGMGLPPVVVGLAVYLVFSRRGPLGGYEWLFAPQAMIVAQTILAFPLVAGITLTSLEAVDDQIRLLARSLGADRLQESLAILREAKGGVMAAILAGFGGIISEVGAAMLVGGNIEGRTRVLSTAIVLETRQGAFGFALALGGVLLTLSFLVNALFVLLQGAPRQARR